MGLLSAAPEVLNGKKEDGNSDVKDLNNVEEHLNMTGSMTSVSKQVVDMDTGQMLFEPPDGGWGWMVVFGTILTGCLVPSLFICFGVFMNAFLVVFPETSKSTASWIPSIMNALMNCMGPITSALVTKYSARTVTFCGGLVLSSGLCLSCFTSSVEALYFTYGIMGGIGAGLAFVPGLYLISQYFKKRRGLATGICMAGGSIGHICFPHIIQGLLDEYSYKGCFLILGGLTMNICVSAALFRPYEPSKPNRILKIRKEAKSNNQNSNMSMTSLTFLPDEGILKKNGTYSSMSSKSIESRKDSKSQIKKKKKSKSKNKRKPNNNNNRSAGHKDNKDNLLLGGDKSWQSLIKPGDVVIVSQNSPRGRSRTLSIDSSRILPGIPEEKEEEKQGDIEITKEKNEKKIENVEDFSKDIGFQETPKNSEVSQEDSIKSNNDNVVNKSSVDVGGVHITNVKDSSKDIGVQETPTNSEVSQETVQNNSWKTPIMNIDGVHIEFMEGFSKNIGVQEIPKNSEVSNGCGTSSKTERTIYTHSVCEPMLETRPRVQRSDSTQSEVVTLNHMFGSVASIASLASLPKKQHKIGTLNNISHSLGFHFFKLAIFYVLAASFSFLIISLSSFTMFIPTYGVSVNLSREESAGLLSIIATASLFGRLILPAITDYITLKRKHIYFFASMVSAASILGTIFVNTYTNLAVCLLGFGFSSGGCLALSINVFLDYISVDQFTSFFGLIGLVVGLCNLFAAPLMGLLVDSTGSYVATFGTLATSSAISGFILYLDRFAVGKSNNQSDKSIAV